VEWGVTIAMVLLLAYGAMRFVVLLGRWTLRQIVPASDS
jgi:hypothetical protein